MSLPLENFRIAVAEGRQLDELGALLAKEGATTLPYPMLSILDSPETARVEAWLREAIAGKFDWLILLTGEGLRRLLGFADRASIKAEFVATLANLQILTRGPKPGQALKEVSLKPTKVAAAPTTDGVIETLKQIDIAGKCIGLQLYNEANPPLTDFLAGAGAKVVSIQPYIYAPASDADRVVDLIERAANGELEAIVFTSSPQVDRVYEIANERKLLDRWSAGLSRVKVASVGPLVTEALKSRGGKVDIQPEQGFQMKNLVVHIRRALAGQ
jgi:uroporphyrinogen-III synthase